MAVVSSGVSITDTTPNLINNPADIKFDNGLIFASTGPIIDPVSLTRTGTFSVSPGSNLNETLVKPDSITLRVFFYQRDDVSAQATGKLLAFDRGTLQLLGSFDVENVAGKASSLIRWGAKGLAFRTDSGQVFIIESSKLIP